MQPSPAAARAYHSVGDVGAVGNVFEEGHVLHVCLPGNGSPNAASFPSRRRFKLCRLPLEWKRGNQLSKVQTAGVGWGSRACLNTDGNLWVSTSYVGGCQPPVASSGSPTQHVATRPSAQTPFSLSSICTYDHPISPSQLCRSRRTCWRSLGSGFSTAAAVERCDIHSSGDASATASDVCTSDLKSSGGWANAHDPNLLIMGQAQGARVCPGLDAYLHGGGDVYVQAIGVWRCARGKSQSSERSHGWFSA
jgi:hypothetical protein